ncbi:MAG: FAD-binding oxidoreductase [Cellvibrionaceae bacterium]|nr:FAD-binding oxidoreductase [Cellvibrionaceae bacterium]
MSKHKQAPVGDDSEFTDKLADIVGAQYVLQGEATEYFATDVYNRLKRPLAVVQPESVSQLQAVMACCQHYKIASTTRGGGASYTDAYLPNRADCVILDLGRLKRIEEINEHDGYVTVECGVTWAELKNKLDPLGLRTPFWGPFSGLRATVGGSVSQNTLSHGSGAYGISAESVIAMDIVVADGSLLKTGSGAAQSPPFSRFFGPDLSGLFTGDCGSLGVKARITLPLLRKRPAHQTISFAFNDFASMHQSMRQIALEKLEDSHFALDGALSQGQIARQDSPRQMLAIALSILKTSPSYLQGIKQLLLSALAAKKVMSESPYMTHYIVEGVNQLEAKSRLQRLREINRPFAREVAGTVPAVVRGMPFAPFFNTLGPAGERWVPLHGVLPHAQVLNFHQALNALYTQYQDDMKRFGIWHGGMFSAIGSSGFLYEIALYWPDSITCYHREVIPKAYLDKLPSYPENLEARRFVERLKNQIIQLFSDFTAVNFQLGKAYPYAQRLQPQALRLTRAIKACLDPDHLIAPGNLGLDSDGV